MVLCDLTAGNDCVKIRFEQTGDFRASVTLKEQLLDERLDYLVGITSLKIPLDQTNMLTNQLGNYDLLTLRRRNQGSDISVAANTRVDQVRNDLQDYVTLTTNPRRTAYLNTAGAFMKHLINWMGILDLKYRTAPGVGSAIVANEHGGQTDAEQGVTLANPLGMSLFKISFDASGVIQIEGTPRGWQNFYFEVTPFGQELLGLEQDTICVTKTAPGTYSKSPSDLVVGNIIQDADMDVGVIYKGKQSIFRSLEHRVSINVESSLPIEQQLLIQNEIESVHTYLESFQFDSSFEVQTIGSGYQIIAPSYVGKHVFRSSDIPCQNWTKLTEFLDLRLINLHISITRRDWDQATKKWKYTTTNLPISETGRWECEITFVSTS